MLIFDELKKNDPQLRLVALVLAGGLFILLGYQPRTEPSFRPDREIRRDRGQDHADF
jgi:hypothetical protein